MEARLIQSMQVIGAASRKKFDWLVSAWWKNVRNSNVYDIAATQLSESSITQNIYMFFFTFVYRLNWLQDNDVHNSQDIQDVCATIMPNLHIESKKVNKGKKKKKKKEKKNNPHCHLVVSGVIRVAQ